MLRIVAGEYLPRHNHPYQILLERKRSGRKICNEAIFASKNEIFFAKISNVTDVHAAGHDFYGDPADLCWLNC